MHTEPTCLVAVVWVSVFKYIFSSSEKFNNLLWSILTVSVHFFQLPRFWVCLCFFFFSRFIFFTGVSKETSVKRLWTKTTSFEMYHNIQTLREKVKRKTKVWDCISINLLFIHLFLAKYSYIMCVVYRLLCLHHFQTSWESTVQLLLSSFDENSVSTVRQLIGVWIVLQCTSLWMWLLRCCF